jgi:hypothetical protein
MGCAASAGASQAAARASIDSYPGSSCQRPPVTVAINGDLTVVTLQALPELDYHLDRMADGPVRLADRRRLA